MKFARCEWTWRNLRGWSPQRKAAAKRAVVKEEARVQAERDAVGLFAELQKEIQPRFTNEEERMEQMDRREAFYTRTIRAREAAKWREGRQRFYRLSTLRRSGLRRLWNRSDSPKDATGFLVFLQIYTTPGSSPWTYLRKARLVYLWNFGGWTKPEHFREVTHNFGCLGIVRHPRVRTQNLILIARLRGESLRTVKSHFSHPLHS